MAMGKEGLGRNGSGDPRSTAALVSTTGLDLSARRAPETLVLAAAEAAKRRERCRNDRPAGAPDDDDDDDDDDAGCPLRTACCLLEVELDRSAGGFAEGGCRKAVLTTTVWPLRQSSATNTPTHRRAPKAFWLFFGCCCDCCRATVLPLEALPLRDRFRW